MKYQLVIFDLDGTLLDTLEDLANAVNYALGIQDYPLRSIDEVRLFVGVGMRKLIERSLPAGSPDDIKEKTFRLFFDYYQKHCKDCTSAYPGITELLRELKDKGIKTAVLSNKADPAVKELCAQYFSSMFDFAAGERPGIAKKPDPEAIYDVLSVLRVDKERAVYVGDSEPDVLTGRNAGIDCVLVDWGFRSREALAEQGAQIIVSDINGLKEQLYVRC